MTTRTRLKVRTFRAARTDFVQYQVVRMRWDHANRRVNDNLSSHPTAAAATEWIAKYKAANWTEADDMVRVASRAIRDWVQGRAERPW